MLSERCLPSLVYRLAPSLNTNPAPKPRAPARATSPVNWQTVGSGGNTIWTVGSGSSRVSNPLSHEPGRSRLFVNPLGGRPVPSPGPARLPPPAAPSSSATPPFSPAGTEARAEQATLAAIGAGESSGARAKIVELGAAAPAPAEGRRETRRPRPPGSTIRVLCLVRIYVPEEEKQSKQATRTRYVIT